MTKARAFATAKNSYANGVAAFPGSQTQWNQNDTLVYRFTLTLQDDNNANGGATPLSSGSHTFQKLRSTVMPGSSGSSRLRCARHPSSRPRIRHTTSTS